MMIGPGKCGLVSLENCIVKQSDLHEVVMVCSESVSGNSQSVTDASLSSDGSLVFS